MKSEETEIITMPSNVAVAVEFKPFLVMGNHTQRSIFKVIELTDEVTREQCETLLQNLPMCFSIEKGDGGDSVEVNEPLDVLVASNIVNIYPPKYCYLSCVSFQSWEFNQITSQMRVDNIMGDYPGGQQRSCVHFDPSVLSVKNWPNQEELEIDVFKYPRNTNRPNNITGRTGTASELLTLLDTIAGGEYATITLGRFEKLKNTIMVAVRDFRLCYENQPEDYSVRQYYSEYWPRIDKATDDEALLKVISELRTGIRWQ